MGPVSFAFFGRHSFKVFWRYIVTPDSIVVHTRRFVKKEIYWKDIVYLEIIEKRGESSVKMIFYDDAKNEVLHLSTPMENIWCLVKMAEYKKLRFEKKKWFRKKK